MPGCLPVRPLPAANAVDRQSAAETRDWPTVIFVDVDGVLNVGVHIKGEAPINLTDANLERAYRLEGQKSLHADRILSAARRQLGHGEDSTYAKLVSRTHYDVSEVLVDRLAKLIRAGGNRCTVVLSSSWRKPQHARRVRRLEGLISRRLGEAFQFGSCTELRSEIGPEDRLECIGQYLLDLGHSQDRQQPLDGLRVLVLEDFCISSLNHLVCRKCNAAGKAVAVEGAGGAERYLRDHAAALARDVRVKVIHTYDSWMAPEGFPMQVGSGLTMQHFCDALSFLGGCCESCANAALRQYQEALEGKAVERGIRLGDVKAVAVPRAYGDERRRGPEEQRMCGCEARKSGERSAGDGLRFDEIASKPGLCIPGQV